MERLVLTAGEIDAGLRMMKAIALADTRIKVNAVCPGFVATDLNAFAGTRTVEQGARAAVRMALLDDAGPTGTFTDEAGPVPW